MHKLGKTQILKYASLSWLSLAVNVIVGILLSPFILHRLGDIGFGIWVLIFSITGYYGLFDLGIRSSIVRFVSKFVATGDKKALGNLINTSLFTYCGICAVCLLVTLVLSAYVDTLFRIPEEFHSSARWLLLMVGGSVALGFPLGIAGGILEGLQRYDILNWTNITSTLARALLIVFALYHQRGLLTIALITVLVPLIIFIVRGIVAMRICPVAIGWRYVDRATFREIANYSSLTFVIIVSIHLKFKTDEVIIGGLMSAAAITYFNIGARIVDYAGEVVGGLTQIFVPMSSHSDATGNMEQLRRIFIVGNRFCAFIIFPICAILIILGKSVIEVWVGQKYIGPSYPVLVILAVSTTVMYAQGASSRILLGMGKHGTWALVALTEGVVNVILSILLVRRYGIVGDSLGTAIPLVCSMVFFLPGHLCRRLGVRMRTYLREAYGLPLVLCVPTVLTMLLMKEWFTPHTRPQLALHFLVTGLVYGAGLLWAYGSKRIMEFSHLQTPKVELEVAAGSLRG
jgi:O-antigen/teichoic acid export membrane protein